MVVRGWFVHTGFGCFLAAVLAYANKNEQTIVRLTIRYQAFYCFIASFRASVICRFLKVIIHY